MMLSEAPAVGGFPSLAPIRTSLIQEKLADASPELRKNEECITPKSEEYKLTSALVCPPAPRKPRPAKRRPGPSSRGFYAVPRDLTSVFLALDVGPEKRIRLG